MKKKLTERYIIDLMKEEWDKKVHSLFEKSNKKHDKPEASLKVYADINGEHEDVLSAAIGLKVKKKAFKGDPMSGLNYDVKDVNIQDKTVILSRPSNTSGNTKEVVVSLQDFQDNYTRE